MTPWQWLQAHNTELGYALVTWLLLLIAFVLVLFWRNRDRPIDSEVPPSDEALMQMTDEQFRSHCGLPQRKEGEQ